MTPTAELAAKGILHHNLGTFRTLAEAQQMVEASR